MKNIHVLPTDKPSRLNLGIQSHSSAYLPITIDKTSLTCPQNIYITDDSEIKEGNWVIAIEGIWKNTITKVTGEPVADVWRKIILTTDKDLIQDGVQAIDDEFLEWFVKNPSCEEVEIDNRPKISSSERGFVMDNPNYNKIIIPKEKPKERLKKILGTKHPKQETLEEAAERILANNIDGLREALKDDDLFFFYKGVIKYYGVAMAKWQIDKQDNFAVGFAEWSVARALGCDSFTINQDELNIYKKYIDTLNGN